MFRARTLTLYAVLILALAIVGCDRIEEMVKPPATPAAPQPSPPAGLRVYVTDHKVGVFGLDVSDNHVAEQFAVPSGASCAAVTPDDLYLCVTSSGANTLFVFNTSGVVASRIPVAAKPYGLALSPDGAKAYVACQGDNEITVVDLKTRAVSGHLKTGLNPYDLAVSSDGTRLWVLCHKDNTLYAYDTAALTESSHLTVGLSPYRLAYDAHGRTLYATLFDSNEVVAVDADTMQLKGKVTVGEGPLDVACTAEGRLYVSNNEGGSVSVVEPAAWQQATATPSPSPRAGRIVPVASPSASPSATGAVAEFPVGDRPYGLALSPDGKRLYVALEGEKRVTVRDCAGLAEVANVAPGFQPTEIVPGPAAR
jgi:YVTN family beta-propeller protein